MFGFEPISKDLALVIRGRQGSEVRVAFNLHVLSAVPKGVCKLTDEIKEERIRRIRAEMKSDVCVS